MRARLIGSGFVQCPDAGMTALGPDPVARLCRALLSAGWHGSTPLEVWRDEAVVMRLRTIAEGAAEGAKDGEPNAQQRQRREAEQLFAK